MDEKKRKFKNIRQLVRKYKPDFVSLDRLVFVCTETAKQLIKDKEG